MNLVKAYKPIACFNKGVGLGPIDFTKTYEVHFSPIRSNTLEPLFMTNLERNRGLTWELVINKEDNQCKC